MKKAREKLSGVNMTSDRDLLKWRLAKYDDIFAEATVSKKKESQARRHLIVSSSSKKTVFEMRSLSSLNIQIKTKRLYFIFSD